MENKPSNAIINHALVHEKALKRAVSEKLTWEQISIHCGIAPHTAKSYCKVLGIDVSNLRGKRVKLARSKHADTIIKLREEGQTLEEIGGKIGITRERVRQILARWSPNTIIRVKHAAIKTCPVCSSEFSGQGRTCSQKCGGIKRAKHSYTRDLAVQIMKLRERGLTWEQVSSQLIPGVHHPGWFVGLHRVKAQVFSSEEIAIHFSKHGEPRAKQQEIKLSTTTQKPSKSIITKLKEAIYGKS
jgi:hypothetical protein